MEGKNISSLTLNFSNINGLFKNVDKSFLRELQKCHDVLVDDIENGLIEDSEFTTEIIKEFKILAASYQLDATVLEVNNEQSRNI